MMKTTVNVKHTSTKRVKQEMNGNEALTFVRERHSFGDGAYSVP